MKTAEQLITELGIRGKRRAMGGGNFKTLCPKCSHTRKHKSDPCLSVRVDNSGVGVRCHNCGWTNGKFFDGQGSPSTIKTMKKASTVQYSDLLHKARAGWK